MIIRSQGKKTIINFENVLEVICNKANEIIIRRSVDDCQEVIGTYSTEEKAVKVLDMIQNAYCNANCYFCSNGYVQNVVFNMPQDSEV